MMKTSFLAAGAILSGTLLLTACSPADEVATSVDEPGMEVRVGSDAMDGSADRAVPSQNIVEVAQAAGSFETLLAAAQAAGLVETLSTGEFTVFAPTDEAFAALPEGTVEALLADPDQLAKVLTYHVVAGRVTAAEVVNLTSAQTVQGGTLSIDASTGTVMVNDATVVQADVMASNGVIHVIDTVLLPR